jgi:tRNA(Ile)-lysidine synthetase-like protein
VRPARAREVVRRELRAAMLRLPEVFAPGTRLVVGFSGGQDSTCLLHAVTRAHRQLELLAVHVDHALRPGSAETAQRVVELAHTIGVACDVTRVDVSGYRRTLKRTSIQQAARAARYQALAAAAERSNAQGVLVAHTADDQAETLLLNLLRGTGLLGLAGMRADDVLDPARLGPPVSPRLANPAAAPLRLIRPLLRVPRAATLAYCTQFKLQVVEDASNQTRAYTRNRVRLDVLPLLEQFNPAIRTVLARTADLAADDLAALDDVVAAVFPRVAHDHEFDLALFRAQPRALQRRLLRVGLEALTGGLVDVRDAPIEDALDLVQTGQPDQAYHLPYGVELCLGAESFTLRREGRARQRQMQKNWEVGGSRV